MDVRKWLLGALAGTVLVLTAVPAVAEAGVVRETRAATMRQRVRVKQEKLRAEMAVRLEGSYRARVEGIRTVPTPDPTPVATPRRRSAQGGVQAPIAPSGDIQAFAHEQLVQRALGDHFSALVRLWSEESGWNPRARNGDSGACGIPQRHPCNGLSNWPAETQVIWGLDYIVGRYGTPTKALAHKHAHSWY